ncbi:uncharacterized protein LOC133800755 isoform X2 [Humulus lupulus]|uniref:uncharacterized protein LOC133800755 isoform X2 n=1 Tax=Humulus lupulus TaxID=3486 RepID=UPI002B404485|nr:uncharacterized protein LOC133800755 isoform X2 [Humulus lupulus]
MDSISSSSTKNNLLILKSRYGNLAVATAVPLLVIFGGSAYLAFTYFNCDDCPWRKKKATVRERSLTLASLQGGEFALQRLVDYEEALANFPYAFRAVECLLNVLLEREYIDLSMIKGDFEKAYFQLECFTEEHCLDSRRPFFKALILVALERHRYTELAKQNWENFNELREEPIEGNETYKVATSFNEFEKIVKRLKNDIHKSNEMKKIPID